MAKYNLSDLPLPRTPSFHSSNASGTKLISYDIGAAAFPYFVDGDDGKVRPWGPFEPLSDLVTRRARRAYYASISSVDENVGDLMKVLDNGFTQPHPRTIVIFHSDHGYSLGEVGQWRKKTNYELAVRVPLLLRIPWLKPTSKPVFCPALLELIDLYPTLLVLAGVESGDPTGVVRQALESSDGQDFSPILVATPDDGNETSQVMSGGRQAAFSQFPACGTKISSCARYQCNHTPRKLFTFMGCVVPPFCCQKGRF